MVDNAALPPLEGLRVNGVGLWWKVLSRNKRTVTADLHRPEGRDLILSLVNTADVLIENFRPGVIEQWGARSPGPASSQPPPCHPAGDRLRAKWPGLAATRLRDAHRSNVRTGPHDRCPRRSAHPPPFGLADGLAGLAGALAVCYTLYPRDVRHGKGHRSACRT
jgi:crotonobetainyl-CoA:carnitine CoA-transferase CaiB-like acyl-CoA transferase